MKEHRPVLLQEVLKLLNIKPGKKYIDSTVGGGGHTEAIVKQGAQVLGIDQDPKSLEIARKHLLACFGEVAETRRACPGVFKLIRGNFTNLAKIASDEHFRAVDGILFDLGFASFQMADAQRGLSLYEGRLDMRLDPDLGVTAADLLNALPEVALYKLLKEVGEEPKARTIARAIVSRRRLEPFATTADLTSLIENIYLGRRGKIHPATKVFMALRITVNSELENLKKALPQALSLVKRGGRIVVVSFHSGEDRIVKNVFRDWEERQKVEILTPKPITPRGAEVFKNPRARSAKLRAVEKI